MHSLLVLCMFIIASGTLCCGYRSGYSYQYAYTGQTQLQDKSSTNINASISLGCLDEDLSTKHRLCTLYLNRYKIVMKNQLADDNNWLKETPDGILFELMPDQTVQKVYYHREKDQEQVEIIKSILGLLSFKLVLSESDMNQGKPWAYQVNETGYNGLSRVSYEAMLKDETLFIEKRHGQNNGHHGKYKYKESIHFDMQERLVRSVEMIFNMAAPEEILDLAENSSSIHEKPKMDFKAFGSLELVNFNPCKKCGLTMGADFVEGSIVANEINYSDVPADIHKNFNDNITCAAEERRQRNSIGISGIKCMQNLRNIAEALSDEELKNISMPYLRGGDLETQKVIIDVLGVLATDASWRLIIKHVIMNPRPHPDLVMQAGIHFIQETRDYNMECLKAFEARVFNRKFHFQEKYKTRLVNGMMVMVLGTMVDIMKPYDKEWSSEMASRLYRSLQTFDQETNAKDEQTNIEGRSALLLALGNARMESSLPLIKSYMNNSDANVLLRTSAMMAMSDFQHEEVAQFYLDLALDPKEDEYIRDKALEHYKEHKHGGDVQTVLQIMAGIRVPNTTFVSSEEQHRVRRALTSSVSRVWQGWQWRLDLTSVNWQRNFGSRILGSSLGLVIENYMDVRLAPLSGHVIVNADNRAWVRFFAFGVSIDIARAEFCFKCSLRYDINILKEFDHDGIKRLARLFGRTLPRVVNSIRDGVNRFSELSHPENAPEMVEVTSNMTHSLSDLAAGTLDFRTVTRTVYEAIAEYSDLPPVVEKAEILVNHVNKLYNDIKTDVMEMYNFLIDAVTVQLPWIWDEIRSAVQDIGESFRNIVDNPSTSIQTIEHSVDRIEFAVHALIRLRQDLREANIFREENRPYWFDVEKELAIIEGMVDDLMEEIDRAIENIDVDHWLDKMGERLACSSVTLQKVRALTRIKNVISRVLTVPLRDLQGRMVPFIQSITDFETISKGVQEGVTELMKGFRDARNQIESIFGPRVHATFPRKYVESGSLGSGFWPSDGSGRYPGEGVMIETEMNTEIPVPFNGRITHVGANHVVMTISGLINMEAIVSNVRPSANLQGSMVKGGDVLGVTAQSIGTPHIHFAMRRSGRDIYIDPSRYLVNRNVILPSFVRECDHHLVRLLGRTYASGSILGDPRETDETPEIENRPPLSELVIEEFGRLQSMIEDPSSYFEDAASRMGIPLLYNKLEHIFRFKMNDITVRDLLGTLTSLGEFETRDAIYDQLIQIQDFPGEDICVRPEALDDNQLRIGLTLQGRRPTGARLIMQNKIWEDEPGCSQLSFNITNLATCYFRPDCLGFSCCLDLKLGIYQEPITISAYVDVCNNNFILKLNNRTRVIHLENDGVEGKFTIFENLFLCNTSLDLYYTMKMQDSMLSVDLNLMWCFRSDDQCKLAVSFAKSLLFRFPECNREIIIGFPNIPWKRVLPKIDVLLDMSVGDVMIYLDKLGLPELDLMVNIQNLRIDYKRWLHLKIRDFDPTLFPSEFHLPELSLALRNLTYGPWSRTFMRLRFRIPIPFISPFFEFGIEGQFETSFMASLRFLSMRVEGVVVPGVRSVAYGGVGISMLGLHQELRVSGAFMTFGLITRATIGFFGFPLSVRLKADMEMVVMDVEFRYILSIGFRRWRFQILSIRIYHVTSPAIRQNVFDTRREEVDTDPPEFEEIEIPRNFTLQPGNFTMSDDCFVYQLPGLDYTEPAFQLDFYVTDDKGDVVITYSVGTYKGGTDVVKDEEMSSQSALIFRDLLSGQPLYFTITARNSQGLTAEATCTLDTYNTSPPGGRVMADYHTTSNPTVLHGSVMSIDESPIIKNMVAVGFGRGPTGDQAVAWRPVTNEEYAEPQDRNQNPLSFFHSARWGALVVSPLRTATTASSIACARLCLELATTQCQSFIYDYGPAQTCSLLSAVENRHIKLKIRGNFFYYERIGVGNVASLRLEGKLEHYELYYINNHLVNSLGYESFITGVPTLVDLTTPEVSYMDNLQAEVYSLHEQCESFVPHFLQARCQGQTPINNSRYIVDGPNTRTIFNGPIQLVETTYTRANRTVSGSWDGIYDLETGILIYQFAVGKFPCEANVHDHRDPHAHIATKSQWTNTAVIYPVNMEDGEYHITVRALNDIEYGGPLSLSVCHSIPYTIDTTPPVISSITNLSYDEDTDRIELDLNATDETSGIWRTEIGFGNDRRNVALMGYSEVENYTHPHYYFRPPDGVPTWAKIRVTDRVHLRDVDHADRPIIVDRSPPLLGTINHGNIRGVNIEYQNSTKEMCVTWAGFKDPESGIAYQLIGIGTEPGYDDVMDWLEISSRNRSWCEAGLQLSHNERYYFSLTALNGAIVQRNVTGYSNGVLVDTTPPVGGRVKDGADPRTDISFSSAAASVRATFNGFYDNESGINYFDADIYRTPMDSNAGEVKIHTEHNLSPDANSLSLNHLSLRHGDIVRTEIVAVNRAKGHTGISSSGFMVDLTNPVMKALVDGADINTDQMFTWSVNSLSTSWHFEDKESGIERYEVSVFKYIMGRRQQEYPSRGTIRLAGDATSWEATGLNLSPGIRYSIRVTAFNGAGLPSVQDTTGVTVDPSPPQMLYARAGVLTGQHEEIINGQVLHSDKHNILASWRGVDFESGIADYLVGIGTVAGKNDVKELSSFKSSNDGVLSGFEFEEGKVYFINVHAVNGAGMASEKGVSSSPIRIVRADTAGYTTDGPEPGIDIDYQVDAGSLTATFSGFSSEQHGLHHMEFCVGTQPGWDDVLPYTNQGILTVETEDDSVLGKSGNGSVQVLSDFSSGTPYHVTIRAVTGNRNVLEAPSDGATPDTTPPSVSVLSVQGEELNKTDSALYIRSFSSISASWEVTEEESRVASSSLFLGTYPRGRDLVAYFNTTGMTSLPNAAVQTNVLDGVSSILQITAQNEVNLFGETSVLPFISDSSPPLQGKIICPTFISELEITCEWFDFLDPESGISKFDIGVGLSEDDDSIQAFKTIDSNNQMHTFDISTSEEFEKSKPMFVTIKAYNLAGGLTSAYSAPILHDDTPPDPGTVEEMSDTSNINYSYPEQPTLPSVVVKCQRSLSTVSVAWEGFADLQSGISRYQVALGTTPGGTQLSSFEDLGAEQTMKIYTGLDLYELRKVYTTVRAFNGVGLHTVVTSSGIYISRASSGLKQFHPDRVYDGRLRGVDLDYQTQNTGLLANWDFSGDPCPIVEQEIIVKKFDGGVLHPRTKLPADQVVAYLDDDKLEVGESYYTIIRATNALGYSRFARSDGITIELEPLIPGIVRDGDIIGQDLSFWPHADKLTANWDGFGTNHPVDVSNMNGNQDIDLELGGQQEVLYYEVAAGTDRRFSRTRENIHPFINVRRNTSWTFYDLDLLPVTGIYYITVRATSRSLAEAEVTSNGVRVAYQGKRIAGEITMNRYHPSVTNIYFSWGGFVLGFPIQSYTWGLSALPEVPPLPDCSQIIRNDVDTFGFEVVPLTDVALDTSVSMENLQLEQGKDYTLLVIAMDESGDCNYTHSIFTVDITKPEAGLFAVGDRHSYNQAIWYAQFLDKLDVYFWGFTDEESGIKEFRFNLYSVESCTNPTILDENLIQNVILDGDLSNFTFIELELQPENVYIIRLEVYNGAGLSITLLSPVILMDLLPPSQGHIRQGHTFTENRDFQYSTTSMEGALVYIPDHTHNPCAPVNPITSETVNYIDSNAIYDVFGAGSITNSVIYPNMVNIHPLHENIDIRLKRDVRYPRMRGGGLAIEHFSIFGKYNFDIKMPNHEFHPITSVMVAPGEVRKQGFYDFIFNLRGGTDNEHKIKEEYKSDIESGFGFQIITKPVQGAEDKTISQILLWARRSNETWFDIEDLHFDPTTDFHSYTMIVNPGTIFQTQETWEVVLLIDGVEIMGVYSVKPLTTPEIPDAYVQVGVYAQEGHVLPIKDILNPPSSICKFQNIRFPSLADDVCRYGNPFVAGSRGVMNIWAGVGTEPEKTDAALPQQVASVCVPCGDNCEANICDPLCRKDELQHIPFTLNGLDLKPVTVIEHDAETTHAYNETVPQIYYLTVYARTGSGSYAMSSSSGIYIDPTPPEIIQLYQTDYSWDYPEQAVEYQGNSFAISAYWEAEDDESLIADYSWAIGTKPGAIDIQTFVSVGLELSGVNTELEGVLRENQTYYVTLRAKNKAGLVTEQTTQGVTILLTPPDLSGVRTHIKDATPFPRGVIGDAVHTPRLRHLQFSWEAPDPKQDINIIMMGMETEGQEGELFVSRPVGLNDSGEVEIGENGIVLREGEDVTHSRRKREIVWGKLQMEPGRSIIPKVRGCNRAQVCDFFRVEPIVFKRLKDDLAISKRGKLQLSVGSIDVKTSKVALRDGHALLGGIITDEDMRKPYSFVGFESFKPFIVDASKTSHKTSIILANRIKEWATPFYYLATLPKSPIPSPLVITSALDPSMFPSHERNVYKPKLLGWCPDEELWTDLSMSCEVPEIEVNWAQLSLSVKVCDFRTACMKADNLPGPDATEFMISGPLFFGVAKIKKLVPFENSDIVDQGGKIQAVSVEEEMQKSDIHISEHTIDFPCENGGSCLGPVGDEGCLSLMTAEDFERKGYTCVCKQNFTGHYCETEMDNCFSAPCPNNYTCTNGVGYYTCSCDSIWWPCYSGLLTWELALIIGISLLIVAVGITSFLWFRYKRNTKSDDKVSLTKSFNGYDDPDSSIRKSVSSSIHI